MYQPYEEPDYFQLTAEFVKHTGQHIFLTGKAGTGKTTFLKHIRETGDKRLVVIAPTGVAAINAGGVTMHSFFQLPLGCFIPGSFRSQFQSQHPVTDRHHLLGNLRYSNEKIELIRNLELLIIDEVSMLRCDWLDAMDILLRHVRRNQREPFGGVQLLFIGDLYQLPPVANEHDWEMLSGYYETPFFFSAQVMKQAKPLCIELKKVYRQSDEDFIHLLNRVRNNEVIDADLQQLQQLYQPQFKPKTEDHFITLTTHNYKADEINSRELKRLPGKEFISKASLSGEFPERVFPAEQSLVLKEGAQVMFIKNDVKEKKYFNGKIGVVEEIDHDEEGETIKVRFPENNETITIGKETWRNIRYSFNESDNKIEEEQLGAFTQYPIRLAWAVTIHKSQGLTFKKAVIDAGAAFAAGQVYVALSRCVSLNGMVLLSPIRRDVIKTDDAIVAFMNQQNSIEQLQPILAKEKEAYTIKISLSLFNLHPLLDRMQNFMLYMSERKVEDKEKIISGLHHINEALLKMEELAEKFREQVRQLTSAGFTEAVQLQLNDRITKAKTYFEKELDEKVNDALLKLNKELQQQNKVRKLLKEMKSFMNFFQQFTNRYRINPQKKEEKFSPSPKKDQRNEIPEEAARNLFELLKQVRRQFAEEENVAPYMICHDSSLREMAMYLPQSLNDMAMIKGMGDRTLSKYGEAFLATVENFCSTNGLHSRMDLKEEELREAKIAKRNKPVVAGDTRSQTFELFNSGKTISEIASQRKLSEGTIEAHLSYFVQSGELDVFRFLNREKFELIKDALQKVTEPGLGSIKRSLDDDVTYSEIRFAIAAINRNTNSN